MFVGSSVFPPDESPVGTCYRLKQDIEVLIGKFLAGSIMVCINFKDDFYDFKDEEGYVLLEVRKDTFLTCFEKLSFNDLKGEILMNDDKIIRKALIVVDVQRDFVDGSLGTKEAREMIPRLVNKLQTESPDTTIFFTMDSHDSNYLDTQEGRKLPISHCVKNTEGWGICQKLQDFIGLNKSRFVMKTTFGATGLYHDLDKFYSEIEIVGLCTDICVISNALLLRSQLPEVEISVDASCCAGTSVLAHLAALKVMESCQITVKNPPKSELYFKEINE